jgi:predicted permease
MQSPSELARRLFRWAAGLLPFDFRRDYGREMELAFSSDLNDSTRKAGASGVWSTWARAIGGLGPMALREHAATAMQDVRYASRMLVQNPGFTATALLSLGIGIGANTAVFSLIDALFLRPLPVQSGDRLVALYTVDARNPGFNPTSYPNYRDYKDHLRGLKDITAYTFTPVNVSTTGDPVQVLGVAVTGNYFQLLGVRPVLGRLIGPDDDRSEGQAPVVVLGNGIWTRQFASDPDIVGRTIRINGMPCTAIGVLPREFIGIDIGPRVDVWLPVSGHDRFVPSIKPLLTERRLLQFSMIGRLADGVTVPQVQAETDVLSKQLQRYYPDANRDRALNVMPLREAAVDPNLRSTLMLASTVVGLVVLLVLLIACANVANLLVGRAVARRTEIAVRVALGAGRVRLARQLLTEQVLLALGGAAVGIGIGALAWQALWAVRPTDTLPVIEIPTTVNLRLLAFSVLVAVGTSLLFGLAPMVQVFGSAPVQDLRDRGAESRVRRWGLRNALLIAEVALSIVALVTAGLFFHSFQNARRIPTGFAADQLVAGYFDLGAQGYTSDQSAAFAKTLVARVGSLPGVRSVSLSSMMPLVGGGFGRTVFLDGAAPPPGGNGQFVATNAVEPNYFDTMGIRLVSGRSVMEYDALEADAVAIVNQTMARRFWPGKDAVGRRFHFFGERPTLVVGVVTDSKVNSVGEDPAPVAYLSLRQWPEQALVLNVRTTGDPELLVSPIRQQIRALDAELPVLALGTMSQHVTTALCNARAGAFIVGIFAAIALALALVGLYGVLSYAITIRRRELAIRIALGAGGRQILSMLVVETLRVAVPAIAIGLVAAAALGRVTAGLLYDVEAIDLPTFIAVPALFLFTACVAAYRPARRATAVDPTTALRQV